MGYRIFLAGASGAIGRRLTPLLHGAGHYICGSTRSEANADALRALGADPGRGRRLDGARAVARAVASARPDVVIHQLTDLPKDLNPREMGAAIVRTARIRSAREREPRQGHNCGGCAPVGGAKHRVGLRAGGRAARGDRPARYRGRGRERYQHAGSDRAGRSHFEIAAARGRRPSLRPALWPRNRFGPAVKLAPIHVDAAAYAALLAIDHGDPGIYNIAEFNRHVATEKGTRGAGLDSRFSSSGLTISHGGSARRPWRCRHPRDVAACCLPGDD